MNRIHLASWTALIALLAMGCERTETPETFPQAAADGWVSAFNSGDVAGLALMYSPDAEILPPDTPIVTGHDAIVKYWEAYQPGQVRIELSDVETFRAGLYSPPSRRVGTTWHRLTSSWEIMALLAVFQLLPGIQISHQEIGNNCGKLIIKP